MRVWYRWGCVAAGVAILVVAALANAVILLATGAQPPWVIVVVLAVGGLALAVASVAVVAHWYGRADGD